MTPSTASLQHMIDVFADHTQEGYAHEAVAQARLLLQNGWYHQMEELLEEKDDSTLEARVWFNRSAAMVQLYLQETDANQLAAIEEYLEFTGYYSLCSFIYFTPELIAEDDHAAAAGRDLLECLSKTDSELGKVNYAIAAFSGYCPAGFEMSKASHFLQQPNVKRSFERSLDNFCDNALVRKILSNTLKNLNQLPEQHI